MRNDGCAAAIVPPRGSRRRRAILAIALVCAATLAGCGTDPAVPVEGRAISMRFDPNRVAGLPATDGPSGPRVEAPSATGRVRGTDDGPIDRAALLAVDDIEDFWRQNHRAPLPGAFSTVSGLVSVDPDAAGPSVCGVDPGDLAFNAAYCLRADLIVWDRVDLLPAAEMYFGVLAINGLLAHEYGHAIQRESGLTNDDTPLLVSEQQADCLAGVYLRWVAEGRSPRFAMNTTDALDRVLAGAIAVRDRPPSFNPFGVVPVEASHGTALDRVSALQQGFDLGAPSCTLIDAEEIRQRRGDIPAALFDPASPHSDMAITEDTLGSLVGVLNRIFAPSQPPSLRVGVTCGTDPAVYCPGTNTIEVDLPALAALGTPADENQKVLLQGDNSAISVVTSRYMLALQRERDVSIEGDVAAMRTACLTGVAQNKMSDTPASNSELVLGTGDLDEAVSGLLTNGIVASDASGRRVPSGFTRILAFRVGLGDGDPQSCYQRFGAAISGSGDP